MDNFLNKGAIVPKYPPKNWTAKKATAYGYIFTQDATSTTIADLVNERTFTGDKTIPDSIDDKPVTSIGYQAFQFCSKLTNIFIPNSVTDIESQAFDSCTQLTVLNIPSSVINIGSAAFLNCPGLTSITSNSPNFRVENQRYLIQNNNNSLVTFAQEGITSAVIPDSVANIGSYSFDGCEQLTNIVIPNSVTNIGYHSFGGCINLASIFIPNRVTTIDSGAFYRCWQLPSISIPSSVTSIGGGVFDYCHKLRHIYIAKPINSIIGAPWGTCVHPEIVWS